MKTFELKWYLLHSTFPGSLWVTSESRRDLGGSKCLGTGGIFMLFFFVHLKFLGSSRVNPRIKGVV